MMEGIQGEAEDSRTSAVGRKRDLAAFEPPHEPSSDHSDGNADRSYKRARQEPEISHGEPTEGTALPQPAPAEHAVLAPPPMTWNKGVQSGLRTSFAGRGPSQSRAPESAPNPEPKDEDSPALGNVAGIVDLDGSQPPPPKDGPAVQPAPPTQPRADTGKSKSKKASKKKGQASEPDTNGKVATKNVAAPNPAPVEQKDPQLPTVPSAQGPVVYENGNGVFALDRILQDGREVKLKNFTPELFAKHFLASNSGKLEDLSAKHLRGAFSTYLGKYYNHLQPRVLDAAREASAKGSKSFHKCLEEARKAVKNGRVIGESKKDAKAQAAKAKPPKAKQSKTDPSQQGPKLPGPSTAAVPLMDSEERPANTVQEPSGDSDDVPMSVDSDDVSPPASPELEREEGEMSSDAVDVVLTDLEIEVLQKYFPRGSGNVTRPTCLACAGSNHKTINCPSFSCKTCGKHHIIPVCPEKVRCLKCRARGHVAKDCPEKLFNPASEGDCCDLCQSPDHLENACHLLWRSYRPMPGDIKRVRDIPVSCYVCGASNHYGPECGLHSGKILSGGITWSRANLQMYLDPSSSDRAISAGPDFSLPKPSKKVFNIRGQADEPIMLDDSDDVVEFLHASVRPSSSKGPSRGINQKIQLAGTQIPNRGPPPASYQQRNAPRSGPSQFGDYNGFQDSGRYGREQAFSPPPRFNDFHAGFNENDRYLPQAPARGEHRSFDGGRRPGENNFRGGQSGRGRGGSGRGGGGGGRGRKRGKGSK